MVNLCFKWLPGSPSILIKEKKYVNVCLWVSDVYLCCLRAVKKTIKPVFVITLSETCNLFAIKSNQFLKI